MNQNLFIKAFEAEIAGFIPVDSLWYCADEESKMGEEGRPHPEHRKGSPEDVTLLLQLEEQDEICGDVEEVEPGVEEEEFAKLQHSGNGFVSLLRNIRI